jgi:hypothetical protein
MTVPSILSGGAGNESGWNGAFDAGIYGGNGNDILQGTNGGAGEYTSNVHNLRFIKALKS